MDDSLRTIVGLTILKDCNMLWALLLFFNSDNHVKGFVVCSLLVNGDSIFKASQIFCLEEEVFNTLLANIAMAVEMNQAS